MKCEYCGKSNCGCLKSKAIIGIILAVLAWWLWTGNWSLDKVLAVVLGLAALKMIVIGLMAFKK
ncbi:MAG: hypothetical protein AABW46_02200 [Nanoarchaeota archaeon]